MKTTVFTILALFTIGKYASAQTDKPANGKVDDKKTTTIEINEDDDSESPIKIAHDSTKNKWSITIGGKNNTADSNKSTVKAKPKKKKAVDFDVTLDMDLGLNYLNDQTDYTNSAFQNTGLNFAGVTGQNMKLKQANSWNVNLWPIRTTFNLYKNMLRLQTRLGFQFYNFKFADDVTFVPNGNNNLTANNDLTLVIQPNSTVAPLNKNKLGVSYISVPLILQYRPKITGKTRLHFGAGVMGGYRLTAWTKQVSEAQGKIKQRNIPGFADYNLNAVGEIGVGKITLYTTYSLTNLFARDFQVYPIAFGIRL